MKITKRHAIAARVVVWLEGCKPVCAGLTYRIRTARPLCL